MKSTFSSAKHMFLFIKLTCAMKRKKFKRKMLFNKMSKWIDLVCFGLTQFWFIENRSGRVSPTCKNRLEGWNRLAYGQGGLARPFLFFISSFYVSLSSNSSKKKFQSMPKTLNLKVITFHKHNQKIPIWKIIETTNPQHHYQIYNNNKQQKTWCKEEKRKNQKTNRFTIVHHLLAAMETPSCWGLL